MGEQMPSWLPKHGSSRCSTPVVASRSSKQRPSTKDAPQESRAGPRPLTVERVSWACVPCGALVRWLLEILFEHRIRKSALALESKLTEARTRQSCLERDINALEESVVEVRRRLAEADEL